MIQDHLVLFSCATGPCAGRFVTVLTIRSNTAHYSLPNWTASVRAGPLAAIFSVIYSKLSRRTLFSGTFQGSWYKNLSFLRVWGFRTNFFFTTATRSILRHSVHIWWYETKLKTSFLNLFKKRKFFRLTAGKY